MKKILWIDDDEKLIDSSFPVFYKYGFIVLKAINISSALTIIRQEEIDGILLDVRLKGENGLEFLEEIHHRRPDLKVVVFTAYPEYLDHVQVEELYKSKYFEKIDKSIPLDPNKQKDFFSALDKVFSKETKKEKKGKGFWFGKIVTALIISIIASIIAAIILKCIGYI